MAAGTESRMVHEGDGARMRPRRKVGREPTALGRGGCAAADLPAVTVEDVDTPRTGIERVPGSTRSRPSTLEIGQKRGGRTRRVLVIADHRTGPSSEPSPTRAVAHGEVGRAAPWIREIADRHDRPCEAFEEPRSRLVGGSRTRCDVAGHEQGRRGGEHSRHGACGRLRRHGRGEGQYR
jgi:hypothetical protein